MSISDMIVVMKDGVVQQIGKPQEVYDQPANLFVARFLGNPPINVFAGKIKAGKLYVGEDAILDTPEMADRDRVTVAIRPEGLTPAPDGTLRCALQRVEIMGRDISVVCTHHLSDNPTVRAIVRAHSSEMLAGEQVRFALAPEKVFLFDPESGERLLAKK